MKLIFEMVQKQIQCCQCGGEIKLLQGQTHSPFDVGERTLACELCMREFGDIEGTTEGKEK